MNNDEYKLEPVFEFSTDESSILLYSGKCEVCVRGKKYEGSGEARLDFLPQARILLHGQFANDIARGGIDIYRLYEDIESFSIDGHEVDGLCMRIRPNTQETGQIVLDVVWCPESEPIPRMINSSSKTVCTVFHLMNFVNFWGEQRTKETKVIEGRWSSGEISHIDLIYDGWRVEIEALLLTTMGNMAHLQREGGYRLTHIGNIQRVDGMPFSIEKVKKYLDLLQYFLSFVKGGWCAPVCPVGFDVHGERIWEMWSSPIERWVEPMSWFNRSDGSRMPTLFHGFMEYCSADGRCEALTEVIYWYLLANNFSLSMDAGIVLTQAAIEKLAYQHAVKEKKLISPQGFRNASASDKFRLLFSSLNIPLDVPEMTPNLRQLVFSGTTKWVDSPDAFTGIRNAIIHAERKGLKGQKQNIDTYEAWNLGLWYLEMSILAVCGYSGSYNNRLRQQQVFGNPVEPVPWKASAE